MWSPGFGPQVGEWIQVHVPRPITFDHLNLQVVADGHHSVPTSLTISTENGIATRSPCPPSPTAAGRTRPSRVPDLLPPAHRRADPGDLHRGPGRDDEELLLPRPDHPAPGDRRAGAPRGRLPGPAGPDARELPVEPPHHRRPARLGAGHRFHRRRPRREDPDRPGLRARRRTASPWAPGQHVIQSASGHVTGFDIDQLVLDSAPGGGAEPETAGAPLPAPSPGPAPTVDRREPDGHLLPSEGDRGPVPVPSGSPWARASNKGWQAVDKAAGHGGRGRASDRAP